MALAPAARKPLSTNTPLRIPSQQVLGIKPQAKPGMRIPQAQIQRSAMQKPPIASQPIMRPVQPAAIPQVPQQSFNVLQPQQPLNPIFQQYQLPNDMQKPIIPPQSKGMSGTTIVAGVAAAAMVTLVTLSVLGATGAVPALGGEAIGKGFADLATALNTSFPEAMASVGKFLIGDFLLGTIGIGLGLLTGSAFAARSAYKSSSLKDAMYLRPSIYTPERVKEYSKQIKQFGGYDLAKKFLLNPRSIKTQAEIEQLETLFSGKHNDARAVIFATRNNMRNIQQAQQILNQRQQQVVAQAA